MHAASLPADELLAVLRAALVARKFKVSREHSHS